MVISAIFSALESNSSLYDYVYNTVTVSDEDTEDDILRKITEGA